MGICLGILTGTTTQGQSGPESNDNKGMTFYSPYVEVYVEKEI